VLGNAALMVAGSTTANAVATATATAISTTARAGRESPTSTPATTSPDAKITSVTSIHPAARGRAHSSSAGENRDVNHTRKPSVRATLAAASTVTTTAFPSWPPITPRASHVGQI